MYLVQLAVECEGWRRFYLLSLFQAMGKMELLGTETGKSAVGVRLMGKDGVQFCE